MSEEVCVCQCGQVQFVSWYSPLQCYKCHAIILEGCRTAPYPTEDNDDTAYLNIGAADNTEPSREEVNSTEVVHKPDPFTGSVKHYEDWQPHEVLPGGPREFISLVNFICSEHGVDPTAQDYREALLLCDSLGVEK